jgi:2-polyprenyl-3-methyl-5-hydroxy-6-metoxy-1,4-benzoquinol methylase
MRTTTAEIQQLYEEHDGELLASFPSLVNGIREHIDRIDHVAHLIKNANPEKILDIGCNRGLFGAMAKIPYRRLNKLVGVDISRLCCAYVTEHMGYDASVCVNASEPFDLQETFDLILCMEIIEHVPSPSGVIANVRRHLSPGGFAIFSCPEEKEEIDGEFHVRRVAREELAHWVTSGGLEVVEQHFFPSSFCEKPKWQGWNFVIAAKPA